MQLIRKAMATKKILRKLNTATMLNIFLNI